MIRVRGWRLTAAVSVGLLLLVPGILLARGWDEASLREIVRTTARTSVILFLLWFLSGGRAPAPIALNHWLKENQPYLFLGFAASHLIHLAALVALGVAFPEPFLEELKSVTVIGGGLVYVIIVAMAVLALRSARTATRPAGTAINSRLPTIGGYAIWIAFANAYIPRALDQFLYVPFAAALLIALAIRVAGWIPPTVRV